MPHFIHLRVHSAFSLSEGAIKVKPLIQLCRQNNMPAVAIADRNNLFGAMEFSQAAAEAGIQPILGCRLSIDISERQTDTVTDEKFDDLILLAKSETGFTNLARLVSMTHLDHVGSAPHLPLSALDGGAGDLIALTGGSDGPIDRLLREGKPNEAESLLHRLKTVFGDRLYVELHRHGLESQRRIESHLIGLADSLMVPLVATNAVYFANETYHEAHDALLCIADGSYISQDDRRRVTSEHYFKSQEQMRQLFADLPDAIEHTQVIAQRCAFMLVPRKPILPSLTGGDKEAEDKLLRDQAAAGLTARLAAQIYKPDMTDAQREEAARSYWKRLDYEIDVIKTVGYSGYFLIVADFIQWTRQQGIPVGVRGSGNTSMVAWALTISDIDPLRFNLLFERFLNPERVTMPDIDVDFCQDRRGEVIRYVQQKYGADRVAQIITFGKLQARAALRDVGRVLQMPYGQVDRLCKLVPNNPANPISLKDAVANEPQLQQARDQDPTVAKLIDIAMKLEGLYRHASTHAAGLVIGDRPLTELVPLYRDPRSDMPVTQFDMKYVEQAGLIKFDFLGLKTLTVLALTQSLLRRRGIDIDLNHIPTDDPQVYDMLGRGDTTGIFQLDGSGMRDMLRRLKPDRLEDIVAVVALYRPGPMDNIPSYIARKHGAEQPDYLHPAIEHILRETFGIMIYQEQVMQIAQELAGYSLGAADLLRRAMGKKIRAEMEAQRKIFVNGAASRGINEQKAGQIFDIMEKFAGYGFPKGHAAAYAVVSYQTAYFKANYPVEFLAASMALDIGSTDKLNQFRQELQRLDIAVLPPDINYSQASFSVEENNGSLAVRYALAAIKNVGAGAMDALARIRNETGPFKSLNDFASRVDPSHLNRRQLENLIAAGAFDALNKNRRQTYEAAEQILRYAQAQATARNSQQVSLFGESEAAGPGLMLPDVEDWPPLERMQREFDAIGFYLSGHPLDSYRNGLRRLGVVDFVDVPNFLATHPTSRVKLAGMVVSRQERTSAKGNRFAFVQLSDATSLFEVTAFSDILAQSRELLETGQIILLQADIRRDEGEGMRLTLQSVHALDDAIAETSTGLKIFLKDSSALPSIKTILGREKKGRGKVSLVLELDRQTEVEMALSGAWAVTGATRAAVKAVSGVIDVLEV